nr:unnamed protein product [Spirometra erinaceieuropaei]
MSFSASLAAGAAANQWNLNGPGSINYPHLRKKGSHPAVLNLTPSDSESHHHHHHHHLHRLSQFEGYRPPVPTICQPPNCCGIDRNPSLTGFARIAPQNRPRRHIILTTERTSAKMDYVNQYCEDVANQLDIPNADPANRLSLHACRSSIPGSLVADLKRWSVAESRRVSGESHCSEKSPVDTRPMLQTEVHPSANPTPHRPSSQCQRSTNPKKSRSSGGRKHIKGLCCSLLILTIMHSCLSCPLLTF